MQAQARPGYLQPKRFLRQAQALMLLALPEREHLSQQLAMLVSCEASTQLRLRELVHFARDEVAVRYQKT